MNTKIATNTYCWIRRRSSSSSSDNEVYKRVKVVHFDAEKGNMELMEGGKTFLVMSD
jgi:hypothetical protein